MRRTFIPTLLIVTVAFPWIQGMGPRSEKENKGIKNLVYDSITVTINGNIIEPTGGDSIYIEKTKEGAKPEKSNARAFYFPTCYFLGIQKEYMVLDCGTGPEPRGFDLINIKTGNNEYEGNYFEIEKVENLQLVYWEGKEQCDSLNCKTFFECQKNGLPSEIIQKVSLDIKSKEKKILGPINCTCTQ